MDDALAGGLIGGGLMLLTGLVIMWMSNRMAEGEFKPNKWAGIRTPSTMKSDEAWYAAHEAGAAAMNAAGMLGATGGLAGIIAGLFGASEAVVAGLILAGALPMTILLIVSAVRGIRAARRIG